MVSFKIEGVKAAIRELNRVDKDVFNKANKAVHDSGFFIEGEVKDSMAGRRAEPKSFDTGNMTRRVQTDNSRFLISKVEGKADYTVFLEKGTRHIKARRHFANTARRNERRVADFVLRKIKS